MLLTVIWLKLRFTETFTIFLQTSLVTRASVVITCKNRIFKKWNKNMYLLGSKVIHKKTYTKQRCHIGVNHPRTFCHSANSYFSPSNLGKAHSRKLRKFHIWNLEIQSHIHSKMLKIYKEYSLHSKI